MRSSSVFSKVASVLCSVCLLCNVNSLFADDYDAAIGKIIVTIDGGSATKKSPISQAIAEKFNLIYVETGALYRVVVDALLRANITPVAINTARVEEFLKNAKFSMYVDGRTLKFSINDVYLTPRELRSEKINSNVAEYGALFKCISDFCIAHIKEVPNLREMHEFDGIIAEGRICGTYFFPKADVKFWFYATNDAKLDFRLNIEKEVDDPIKRDSLDLSRKFYPMVKPDDAVVVWTSSRSVEDNINLVSAFIDQKIDLKKHSK